MSNIRSRSPAHRRGEYSFNTTSLSGSGGVNDARTSFSSRRPNKSDKGRRNNPREHHSERETLRDKDERNRNSERGNEKYAEYQKYRKSKPVLETREQSPEEESYLKSVLTLHKEQEIITANSEKRGGIDECMLDPSMCNFRGTSQSIEDEVDLIQEDPVRIVDRKKSKDETDNRLERLEKLVELLVNNNKSQPTQSNTTQESRWVSSNKSVFELVPRNTDFTTSMWLNKVHEECVQRNFDEKTSIQFLESKMTGIIKAWYKTIPSYDFSWPELKMLITKTFPDNVDFASTLKLLVGRKKKLEESVTQYYFSKMYLLEACKISGLNAVSCLIDGLENESFKQDAKSHNFLTPEALYSQFLLKLSFYHNQEDISQLVEYEESYTTEPDYIENAQDHDYRLGNKAKKCYTCGKVGHLTVDCRHAPHCYRCKKGGHIAANCSLKFHKILMISSEKDIDKFNYKLCYINGKKVHAYIDTGCNIITIKEGVARDLKLNFNSSQQIIQGYGGGFVKSLGEVRVFIKIDSVECVISAVVVPDDVQATPLIIGQPLLYKHDVVMVLQNSGIRLFAKNLDTSYKKMVLEEEFHV